MDIADDNREARAGRAATTDLAQLMAAARASTVDAMERLLDSATTGELPTQLPAGTGYLLFVCAGRECAVPLSALREVLPAVPRTVYLPFSPEWMVGIFPLRNEMIGLVDPVPLLMRTDTPTQASRESAPDLGSFGSPLLRSSDMVADGAPGTALVVGNEDRCLAWAVDSIGDIALVQDAELRDLDGNALRGLPFARRYVTQLYSPHDAPGDTFVLNAEALLADLLDALAEEDEGHHG
ncbi:MAG: chemotaxis protein CheW [Ktedonobacterales bacterium]